MSFVALIAVFLAGFLTVPLLALVHGLRHPRDPQAGMAGIYFFMIGAPRWALLAVGVAVAVGYGGLDWLVADRGAAYFLAFVVHALAGGASLMAQFGATERRRKWFANVALVVAIAFPALTIAFVMTAVYAPQAVALLRVFAVGVPAMVLFVGLAIAVGWLAGAPRRAQYCREAAERAAEKQQVYYAERKAQLDAIGDGEPLYKLIQFTYCNEPGDVAELAKARILARPTFLTDMAAALRGNACYEGLWFLARHMPAPLPAELADPAAEAIRGVADDVRKKLSHHGQHWPNQQFGEVQRALETVDKFGKSPAVDFGPALARLHAALSTPPGAATEAESRDMLEDYCRRRGLRITEPVA